MKSVATRKVSLPRWLVIAVSSVAIVSGSVLVVLLMQRETPRQENSSNAIRPAESKKGTETEKPRETRDTVSQFVEVPDLITMSIEDATALVQNLGLRAVPLGSARSDDEKGKVFKTFPKSGARIERGKTITLHYGE